MKKANRSSHTETQCITIKPIKLSWSPWYQWNDLAKRRERQITVAIDHVPGVYEVRHANEDLPLTIGESVDPSRRVLVDLVRPNGRHSAGKRIRKAEPLSKLLVRWAATNQIKTVEEELHRLCRQCYGSLPKHTKKT